tara:strand:+ start:1427 stop:1705 length:279 start_codon:yes stop_codon:yes gene_type:complete
MGLLKRPKMPEPTAEELAVTARQKVALNKEIEDEEKRLKALSRGGLGTRSMLAAATPMGNKAKSGGKKRGQTFTLFGQTYNSADMMGAGKKS